jgi:hypothetical protein
MEVKIYATTLTNKKVPNTLTNDVTFAEGKLIMQELDVQTYEDYVDMVIYLSW